MLYSSHEAFYLAVYIDQVCLMSGLDDLLGKNPCNNQVRLFSSLTEIACTLVL